MDPDHAIGGTVRAILVFIVVYMAIWFFGRNIVEGAGPVVENGAHLAVVLMALVAAKSSYRRATRGR